MYHIFLLGREGFNYQDFLIYNITNSLFSNPENTDVYYHVSCLCTPKKMLPKNTNTTTFFNVSIPNLGPIKYLLYDLFSLIKCFNYIKKNKLNKSSIFLLSTRIGIFLPFFIEKFKKYNVSLYIYGEHNTKNIWTPIAKTIWKTSEYFCIKYSKMIISTNTNSKNYFLNTYKKLNAKITELNYDFSDFDKSFESFLKKFNLNLYDYYLLIDDFNVTSISNFVIEQFLKCNSTKKLVILSNKTSFLYKQSIINLDFFKDNRIISLNIKRFIHQIPHLSTYCHAYIHSNKIATKNKYYFKHDNLNLIIESLYNLKMNLPNTIYFNKETFLDIIKKTDSIEKKSAQLKNSDNSINNILQDILTK